jgi:hypothetical protein
MYKIILIFATLLFSTGAFAKPCDNSTLQGTFGYEVNGVNSFPLGGSLVTQSTHVIGRVSFDGKGKTTFKGVGSAAGSTAERTGTGTYVVKADCSATGTIDWSTGETSEYWIIPDQMDDGPQFNRAYHANVLVTDNNLHSSSGSMTRRIGKFK